MAIKTTQKPTFKPHIDFKVDTEAFREQTTIVHCTLFCVSMMRIWPTTYLVQDNGQRKKLLHAYNISEYPVWQWGLPGHRFTLVFEGLDRNCLLFDLLEDIPEPGGLHIENIERNQSDVYWLSID